MKNRALFILFAAMLCGLLLAAVLLPDRAVSYTERRRLNTFSAPTVQSVFSGKWAASLEKWLPDQFPLRESFRSLAMRIRTGALRLSDYNGAYTAEGKIVKTGGALSERSAAKLAEKAAALRTAYFPEAAAVAALIPDKGYYLAAASGRPTLDFDRMEQLFFDALPADVRRVSLAPLLTAADYYDTDIHWRQERISAAAAALCAALDAPLPETAYVAHEYAPFYGSYYGQAAGIAPDALIYLESGVTAAATVENRQKPAQTAVYDAAALGSIDSYDVFLGGATPLVTVTNTQPAPSAVGRRLILFRDSFGSSVAPLLLSAYEQIVLVDLRYMASSQLAENVDFGGADVLFLYSSEIVNNSALLR